MALVNCSIEGEIVVAQTSGEGNITAYELYIIPDEGYFVAAKDFQDNTYDTFSSYVQGIIDFGETGKLILTDTTTEYTSDNKVRITVNLYSEYSITEDTTLTVDIDGEAWTYPYYTTYVNVLEYVSFFDNGSTALQLEPGVTVTTQLAGGSVSWVTKYKRHEFTFDAQVDVETKVATIVFSASEHADPSNYVNFLKFSTGSLTSWLMDTDTTSGFRWEYTEYPDIGEGDLSVETSSGTKATQKTFTLYFTPQVDFVYIPYAGTAVLSNLYATQVIGIKTDITSPAKRSRSITNVTTDLGSLPSGSSNVIPSSGITASATPVVKVYGTPGAVFEVEFKETKVVEGGSNSRSTNTGAVEFFDGIIPNMPIGSVIIPKSGVYSFKMPDIASFTTTGRKEFEMKITAGINTIIKSNVIKTGGTSVNIGAINSIVTNKFYQYPKVNIEFAATALPAGWAYTHSDYNISSIPDFGGSGANKTGIPLMPPSSNPKLASTTRVINFEIRVTDVGTFSLNQNNTTAITNATGVVTHNIFDKSQFAATISGNRDIVKFYNLKAYIGEGTSDVSADANDFATITGSIRCTRFGYQNQVYTIDLSEIFTFA